MFHNCFVSDHMFQTKFTQIRFTHASVQLQLADVYRSEYQKHKLPVHLYRRSDRLPHQIQSEGTEWCSRHAFRVREPLGLPALLRGEEPSEPCWFEHILILVFDNLLGNDGYIDDLFLAGSSRRMGQLHVCDQKRPQARRKDGSRQSQLVEQRWIPWILDQIRKRELSCWQREWGMFIVTISYE